MSAVIGLDLSLTSTGLAIVTDAGLVEMGNIKSTGKKADTHVQYMPRIVQMGEQINDWLADVVARYDVELAIFEAPSFNSKFGNPHERAGLWWKVYEHLWLGEVPIQTVAPMTRAKFITGNGRAKKEEVLIAARERWGEEIPNHDVADATGLAMWGWERLHG